MAVILCPNLRLWVRFAPLCLSLCSVACQFYHLQNGHFASHNGHFASNLPCFGAVVLHLLPVYLCRIKITSPLWGLLFFTFGLQFAAFYPAFCSVLPCVLLHFTLRFAVFCTAFCGTLHCVLLYFALLFGAKRNCFASFVYLCSLKMTCTLLCAVPNFTLVTPCNTPFFAAEWQAG